MIDKPESIGIGLIGIGEQAQENLIPAILNNSLAKIVAVSSRNPDRADALKARFRADHAFHSYQDLIGCDDVDAIVASGPPGLHEAVLRDCLTAGKHVFVEKPPAASNAALDELIALAEANPDVVTFVDYSFRFGAPYTTLLDALSADGEMAAARIRCVSSKPTEVMWGNECIEQSFLLTIAVHPIAMILDLFGEIRNVTATQVNLLENRFAMDVTVSFVSGAVATLQLGNYATRFEFDVELMTRDGAVGLLQRQSNIQLSGSRHSREAQTSLGPKACVELDWPSLRGGYAIGGYQKAIDSFLDETGQRRATLSPLAQSRPVLQAVDAILGNLGHPELAGGKRLDK